MMNCQTLTVISYLQDFKRDKAQLEENHCQNPQKRRNLRLMNDKERRNLSSNKFSSRNFKRKKNSYERFKKICERKKTSKVYKRSWRRKLTLIRKSQTFRMIAFSYKSIFEIKNFKIKEEISFQILIDIQTPWKFHMKSLIKWAWDAVLKELTTTWALCLHTQSKLDWVKTQKSTLQKVFHRKWQM